MWRGFGNWASKLSCYRWVKGLETGDLSTRLCPVFFIIFFIIFFLFLLLISSGFIFFF